MPTVAMAPLPAISVHRPVAAVVAPATSRSHVVPSVVAPATSRSTSPAPVSTSTADVAATATDAQTEPGPERPHPTPSALQSQAPRRIPANGGIFVGSQTPRRPGSLVARVRRRQAEVDEPEETAATHPTVEETVTVISRMPRREPAPEPWTPAFPPPLPPTPASPLPPVRAPEPGVGAGPDWGNGTRIEMHNTAEPRDLATAARRTALIVGSRAREVILGYPFPAAETGTVAPYSGEEPAPGQTVVLVGDDVEAWVRERLYGGRLPNR
jgi:hypothetical protein